MKKLTITSTPFTSEELTHHTIIHQQLKQSDHEPSPPPTPRPPQSHPSAIPNLSEEIPLSTPRLDDLSHTSSPRRCTERPPFPT
mmetsp:Transcript_14257/g.29966  ORF Transcript_14257/g.29966 Transcript_14257/m.29966 type:complete len:84 (-) Transcript_14257:2826-3077(-)